jgi:ubiquinone/menaquinone biosynthesis C-methylase UbiE
MFDGMARLGHLIHTALVESLNLAPGHTLLDLGCGQGGTLRCAVDHVPSISVIGIDSSQHALDQARELLSEADARLECADLSQPIPLRDGTIDRIVCHNVLECLANPAALLSEASRLLAPGGRAVWSHVDCGGIMLNASDEQANRAVMAAYADSAQPWMDHVDGHMGRKLPGLVRQSALRLEAVRIHTSAAVELEGDALARLDEIVTALTVSPVCELSPAYVTAWRADVDELAASGHFFFLEPTIIVTAVP